VAAFNKTGKGDNMELIKIKGNTYYIQAGTNIGVISFKNKNCLLVDTAINNTAARKIDTIISENSLHAKYIINTHSHEDHCGGNNYFKDTYPGTYVYASEIEKICGGDYEIKNSVQGFIGDFGRYVLNTVEYWTATLISDKKAKSIREFKYEFAQTLPEDLKDKYIKILDEENREIDNEEEFDLEEFLKSISEKEIIEAQDDIELSEKEKDSTI
jgi:hypothetical protein